MYGACNKRRESRRPIQRCRLKRMDALPILDTRPEDEILGYDDRGTPSESS